MITDYLPFLVLMTLVGGGLVGAILAVRGVDQRARDARRSVVTVRLPRGKKIDGQLSVVRAIVGLAPAASGLLGRDTVALEIVGTLPSITFRLRLPAHASAYLIAQLRAAFPGIAVEEVADFVPERCTVARELRRHLTSADLSLLDPATSRTILAALINLHRGESTLWTIVVGGGISPRPAGAAPLWQRLWGVEATAPRSSRIDHGVVPVTIRIGAVAGTPRRAHELVERMRRAAGSVSAPGARLVSRQLPSWLVVDRIARAATPITAAPILLQVDELARLWALPEDSLIPGASVGGSPQLPAAASVPSTGRALGRSTANDRAVAQPVTGASEHTLVLGPTGSGKSWLAARLLLDDVTAGRGALLVDPKGSVADAVIERLPEEAIGRTVVADPGDIDRPVPLPLLAREAGGIRELPADTLVGLLRHRTRDLGPRSTDILTSSLYALDRLPNPTIADLLTLWGDGRFRSHVAGLVSDDPVLAGFFAWFEGLGAAERNYILAAPLNKIRPLLQRSVVRNVLAAPRATFTMAQALRDQLVVIVPLREGVLGSEATSLLGQVVVSRVWAAVQARTSRRFYNVTIDEAPRFVDQPTDLGDMLARSREYGVGVSLIAQSLAQFPDALREVALNSARTKIGFGTSAKDARSLASEFGPEVQPDFFTGLARYEAIGSVSLRGTVSPPFTFVTEALGPSIPGRAKAVRRASRERFGIPREEIEASLRRPTDDGPAQHGPVGRRVK